MNVLVPIKKVVHYHELQDCKVGRRALVWPIDHPDIPVGAYAKTTTVQSFDPLTGVVETANTRYAPGPFGEWSESKDYTPTEMTFDHTSFVPSMASQF